MSYLDDLWQRRLHYYPSASFTSTTSTTPYHEFRVGDVVRVNEGCKISAGLRSDAHSGDLLVITSKGGYWDFRFRGYGRWYRRYYGDGPTRFTFVSPAELAAIKANRLDKLAKSPVGKLVGATIKLAKNYLGGSY